MLGPSSLPRLDPPDCDLGSGAKSEVTEKTLGLGLAVLAPLYENSKVCSHTKFISNIRPKNLNSFSLLLNTLNYDLHALKIIKCTRGHGKLRLS